MSVIVSSSCYSNFTVVNFTSAWRTFFTYVHQGMDSCNCGLVNLNLQGRAAGLEIPANADKHSLEFKGTLEAEFSPLQRLRYSLDHKRPIHIVEDNLLHSNVYWFDCWSHVQNFLNSITYTVFDEISGHHCLAKLTQKFNHHSHLGQVG